MDKKEFKTKFSDQGICAGCMNDLNPDKPMNALSRYDWGYICNDCGTREALQGNFIGAFFKGVK